MKTLLLLSIFCFSALGAENLIAVNVALVVQETAFEEALERNRLIRGTLEAGYPFDGSHFPHVTILQLFIAPGDLKKLGKIVKENLPRKLSLEAAAVEFSALEKDPSQSLVNQNFHTNQGLSDFQTLLLGKVDPLKKTGATSSAFYEKQAVDSEFISYVSSYPQKHSGAKYKPHITLGVSRGALSLRPMGKANFDKLAIYQLGNFGTARKELFSFDLKD